MADVRFAWGVPRNPYAGLGAREIRNEKFSCRVDAESRNEIFGTRNSEFHVFFYEFFLVSQIEYRDNNEYINT